MWFACLPPSSSAAQTNLYYYLTGFFFLYIWLTFFTSMNLALSQANDNHEPQVHCASFFFS